jgi:PAS domain S-box-containing protein
MTAREPVNILLVDDQPAKLLTYQVILEGLGENLIKASSAREAFDHLLKTDVAVVLVDVCMPELDGFELVAMLRGHPRFEHTAVIFVSAIHQSEPDLLRGYETGAVDYVPVPVVPEILRAKVRIFVDLFRKTRELEALNRELEHRVVERTMELQSSTLRLLESEERFKLASEAAAFGTYDYNVAENRLHCSPSLKRLLGNDADGDISLEAFLSYCHPDDRETVRGAMHSSIREAPRQEIEFRIRRADGATRWLLDRGASISSVDSDDSTPLRVMGIVVDITERKQGEEQQLLLMAELDHRVKNVLANVSAMARLSSKNVQSVAGFVDTLEGRIHAMSRAHGLLREGNWTGADLADLANVALQPFRSLPKNAIEIRGGSLPLNPKLAQSLALVLHELATNAAKHGALSVPGGSVTIEWVSLEGTRQHRLSWRERGGPPVKRPKRRGFGLTVLARAAAEIGAQVDNRFDPDGFSCELVAPLAERVALFPQRNSAAAALPTTAVPLERRPMRVLIVEDDMLIALQMESDLLEQGYVVVGPAHSLQEGLELLATQPVDAALLDINLGQGSSFAIAEQLKARHAPFAFITGYSDTLLIPDHLRAIPSLRKPFHSEALVDLVAALAREKGDPPVERRRVS